MATGNEETPEEAVDQLVDEDDDVESQMAAAMAAEGLGDGEAGGDDEDDLESQMAAAMMSEDEETSGDGDLVDDNLSGSLDDADVGADAGDVDDDGEEVPVQNLEFQQLRPSDEDNGKENIDRLLDVSLNLSVELGRKNMQIKEILDLGPGKIIELDKLAGEPVDLLVNGRLLAKGEVVVVDENFGVRITDLVDPKDRIRSL